MRLREFLRGLRPTRHWLVAPPIAVGILVLLVVVSSRSGAPREDQGERRMSARVITVHPMEVIPRALGYGEAVPGDTWDAVAQVRGRVVGIHPRLEVGEVIPADTVILRIDTTDYELSIAQIEAQLRELAVGEANTRASLAIERRSFDLSESNLEDKRRLLEQGTISQSAFDETERSALAQRLRVQQLESTLALIPPQRERLEVQLTQGQTDLARTEITTPFACRITETAVEVEQFVSVGQVLARTDAIATSEVPAQFFAAHLRPLVQASQLDHIPLTPDRFADLDQVGITATARLRVGEFSFEWDARVARVSPQMDPQTRTIGIIVTVDDSYTRAIPGEQPPLMRGMYCEVELRGPPISEALVIPREALHEGNTVYLVDEESRLEVRPVRIAFHQSDFSVIEEGLTPGDAVVVSDLIPAIERMLIDPTEDGERSESLAAEAGALRSVR
jgi:RND family efflux transporter MFP subunit